MSFTAGSTQRETTSTSLQFSVVRWDYMKLHYTGLPWDYITSTYARLHDNTLQYITTHTHRYLIYLCKLTCSIWNINPQLVSSSKKFPHFFLPRIHQTHPNAAPTKKNTPPLPGKTSSAHNLHGGSLSNNSFLRAELALAHNGGLTIRSAAAWSWPGFFSGAGSS